ncbi:MAG: hypothetical protein U9Q00_01290 [Synergistota bacterium]|jgi:hypothetical protein|nr:hypothetical protein [Synergistota bacterium]
MTERIESIRPVKSIAPTKLKRVERRGKDGKGSNKDWEEALEEELRQEQDREKDEEEGEKNEPEEREQEKAPPPSKPIIVHGHLDVKA